MSSTQTFTFNNEKKAAGVRELDMQAEYLDEYGIPRRSAKVTRRMVMKGVSVEKEGFRNQQDDDKEEDGNTCPSPKALANAEFKAWTKQQRAQAIQEGEEYVKTRLQVWYDRQYVEGIEKEKIALTDEHTIKSPSKTDGFVDQDGNIRRIRPKVSATNEAEVVVDGSMPSTQTTIGQESKQTRVPEFNHPLLNASV